MTVTAAQLEEARRSFAQLRCLAGSTPDPELRERLHQTAARLLDAIVAPVTGQHVRPLKLTVREIDVLAVVAIGATNSEVAERLGITTETVKGYLRTAMHKLQATNRFSAVQSARRHRFIP
ncbi:hypothetical protein KIH74_32610 [Kineosporia sp. J2-2]|uniref:HTH luxR-type domain-containing protein n=1 Tax=Kineosporia corallincola TaxID=2835133 RepID=A0ABS5TSE1_9ACTN|nr:helix-turn-helix transcriptional regulator [Kineosporia corallincola]MBT0773733.1 hypothetical protein [Kineosporia corallincola]